MQRRAPPGAFRRAGLAAGIPSSVGAWLALGQPAGQALAVAVAAAVAAGGLAGVALHFERRAPPRGRARRLPFVGLFFALGVLAGSGVAPPAPGPSVADSARERRPLHLWGTVAEPVAYRLGAPGWFEEAAPEWRRLVVDVHAVAPREDARGSVPAWRPARFRALLSGPAPEGPRSGAGADAADPAAGDLVEVLARVRLPPGAANPGEDDHARRLARSGISVLGTPERGTVAVVRPASGARRRAEVFRSRFVAAARQRLASRGERGPDVAALVGALAVGDRRGISAELSEAFQSAGLAHLLALSGFHVAAVVGGVFLLLRRAAALAAGIADRIAPRRLAAALCLPLTAAYVVTVGGSPPTVRAGVGLSFVCLAVLAGRSPDLLNTFGWCLAALALLDPVTLDSASTQLSFAAVTGLVLLGPPLRRLVPLRRPRASPAGPPPRAARLREALLQVGVASAAATLATWPLAATYFERAPLLAVPANLAAWPAAVVAIPAAASSAALFALHPALAGPALDLAGVAAEGLVRLARMVASAPGAMGRSAPPSPPALLGWALVVAVLALGGSRRELLPRIGRALPVAALLLLAGAPPVGDRWTRLVRSVLGPAPLELTFLSVGQGDAAVIRFPLGSTMVVDAAGTAGGHERPGVQVVSPFLRTRGVHRLDVVVATHPHPDHVGGLPPLLQRFAVGELWHAGVPAAPTGAFLEAARRAGVRLVEFRAGLPGECAGLAPLAEALPEVAALSVGDPRCATPAPPRWIDGVRVEVLHPLGGPERPDFPELGENDNSLVLRLTHGPVRVLFTGDLEREGEALLLARGEPLEAEILKVPHHGSRTSSTPAFVEAVRPRHVVFCVGEHNAFGFPHAEVEARYRGAGCELHRTDRDGAVTFRVHEGRIDVRRYRRGG